MIETSTTTSQRLTAQDQIAQYATVAWQPDDLIELRCIPVDRASRPPVSFWTTASALMTQFERLKTLNAQGMNIFVGILPRRQEGGRTDDDCAGGFVVWAEFDGVEPRDAWKTATDAGLPPPSMAHATGHGTHLLWALTERTAPAAISTLVANLAALLGSDPTVKNPSRILRLPGFKNWKEPVADAVLMFADPSQRYAFDALRAAVPTPQTETPKAGPTTQSGDKMMERARKYLATIPGAAKGNRNAVGFRVAAALRRDFALSDADAWALLCSWNALNNPSLDEKELRAVFNSAAKHGKHAHGEKAAAQQRPSATVAIGAPVEEYGAPAEEHDEREAERLDLADSYCPFPTHVLPEPIRSFVVQAAEAIGCDAAFMAVPLLVAAASAIGNTRRLELKRGWTEPAILWGAIVGESGTLKSPASERALRPIRRRQQKAMKSYATEMEAYNAEVLRYEVELAAWKRSRGKGEPPEKPKEPACPRCMCGDTTIEKLAILLLENWRGLLMARDELAAWFGGFDRYTQGKGGDAPKWLEMHGGRSVMVDRKTGNPRTIYIPRAAVSVTGGIQPATLQRVLGREYFENGLVARLLLAYPPRQAKQWTESEVDWVVEDAVATMLDRLFSLEPIISDDGDPEPAIVRLSPAAKEAWIKFYNEHAHEQVDLTDDLSAAWSKLEGYAARLALVIHLARWAADDVAITGGDVVDETSVAAGVTLSRWFGQEARRVYAIFKESDEDHDHRLLVDLVRAKGGRATVRELMRGSRLYARAEEWDQALAELVKGGFGRWENPGSKGPGRPKPSVFVLTEAHTADTMPQNPNKSELCQLSTVSAVNSDEMGAEVSADRERGEL